MEPMITDYQAFLTEAKEAVSSLDTLQKRQAALETQVKQTERQLSTEEREVSERITQMIRKRASDISSSYDKELEKYEDNLKKARSRREKAKNLGVQERIAEETAELREENRNLDIQMKTLFRQNHVPGFCRSNWYYAMYFPSRFKEFLQFIVTILICFLGIPCGCYFLIPNHKPIYLVAVYFVTVLLFGGIYIKVGNMTKDPHGEVIREGKLIRDKIFGNQKKIRVITNTIRKDKNESVYDLKEYDDEIAQIQQILVETGEKKKDALNTFEKVTKQIITDEIKEAAKEKLDVLRQTLAFQQQEYKSLTEEISKGSLYITDTYGNYLEKDFLQADKLDALSEIMEKGTAVNLSEAMETYRKNRS